MTHFRIAFLFLVLSFVAAGPGRALADPSDPDAGFGSGGVVIENLGSVETGGGVLRLSTGKLLLTGSGNGSSAVHAFTRYNDNGTKDMGYGVGGTASGFAGSPWGITLLPDDSMLMASDVDTGSLTELNDAAVIRYTSTGAKDTTFGDGGRVTFRLDPTTARDEHATSVIRLASGKLLVGGWFWKGGTDFDIAVLRLDAAGNIDSTFADNGHFNFDFAGGADKVSRVLELPDKKIIVYGEVEDRKSPGNFAKVFFLRLTENGEIDTTFGGNGTGYRTIITDVNGDSPGGMVRLASGKFLFAVQETAQWTAARLTEDGIPDADFGTGGVTNLLAVFDPTFYPAAQSAGLAVQKDGRFVIGGWVVGLTAQYQLKYGVGLARFEENGTPDTTFHSGSAQRTYNITDTAPEGGGSVVVQKDGKIVLGGSYSNGSDDRFMLRVNGDVPQGTTTTSTTSTTLPGLCGDVNGDGKVKSGDALATLRAAVGLISCPLSLCDATGDGKVKSGDALRVLQYAVGGGVAMNCPA